MEVCKDRNFCQNALRTQSHLQLWAIWGTLETSLHLVICAGLKPLCVRQPLEHTVACPELPEQRA